MKYNLLSLILFSAALASSAWAQSKSYTNGEENDNAIDTTGDVTLTVNTYERASQYGVISGSGDLTKSGGGGLTLYGVNTYTGDTYILSGSLTAGNNNAFGTSALHISVGANLILSSSDSPSLTINSVDGEGNIQLANSSLTVGDANDQTFSGRINGTASSSFIKQGSGTLTFAQSSSLPNTSNGTTIVNAGTLAYATRWGFFERDDSIALNFRTELTVNSGGTAAFYLGSVDQFSETDIANILSIADFQDGSALGLNTSQVSGGTFTLTLDIADTNSGANSLAFTKSGSGTLVLEGLVSNSGGITVTEGNLEFGAGSTATEDVTFHSFNHYGNVPFNTHDIVNDGQILMGNGSGLYAYAGTMSGSGSLTKTGSGSLFLLSANSHSGDTTVSVGTLLVGDTNALQNSTLINNGAVTFNRRSYTTSPGYYTTETSTPMNFGGLSGSGTVLLEWDRGGATIPVELSVGSNGADTTFSGTLSGAGSFTKTGTGDLTLSGNNAHTGTTVVSAGTLTLAHANALGGTGTGTTIDSGATLALTNDIAIGSEAIANAGTVTNTSGANSYAGVLSGSGNLTVADGNLTLTGANTYHGTTTVAGGILTGNASTFPGAITNNAAVVFDQAEAGTYTAAIDGSGSVTKTGAGNLTLSGAHSYTGGTTVSAGVLTGTTASLTGAISNSAVVVFDQSTAGTYAGSLFGTGILTKSGSGQVTFSGNQSYTGNTHISAGTLTLSGTTASATLDLAAGATLDLSVAAGSRDNVAHTRFTGTGTLAKTGSGTLVWGVAQATYALGSGALIDVQAGQFTGGSDANETWTDNLADLHVASGATFAGAEANVRVDTLTGAGTIRSGYNGGGYSAFTFGVDHGSGTFSGVLADTVGHIGNFVKAGSGHQVLTGDHTYTGSTTISNGTLTLGAGGATGSVVGSITNHGTLVFDRSGDHTYAGVVSGHGDVIQDGAILRLSSAQTYTGSTTLKAGAYLVLPDSVDQGLSASTSVAIETGAVLDFSNRNLTLAGLSGAGSVYSYGGSAGHLSLNVTSAQTFAGVLGSTYPDFAVTKTGSESLTLSGNNTYTGTTTISAGTLALDATGTIANSGTINLGTTDSTGTLDVTAKSGFSIGSHQTLSGVGSVNLGAGNTLTIAGTFAPGNSAGLVTVNGNLSLDSASTLNFEIGGLTRGTQYDAINIDGAGNLTFGGTLNVSLIDDFVPTEGNSFGLFNYTTASGTFDTLNLASLSEGLTWNTSALYTTGVISVVASAVPEPSSYAALFGLLTLAVTVIRRRR